MRCVEKGKKGKEREIDTRRARDWFIGMSDVNYYVPFATLRGHGELLALHGLQLGAHLAHLFGTELSRNDVVGKDVGQLGLVADDAVDVGFAGVQGVVGGGEDCDGWMVGKRGTKRYGRMR